jgi:DNA-directed RNA polymerase specialized sigma24 family protein
MQPQSVSQLIDALQKEDVSVAQTALWRRYYTELVRRVSQRLGRQFRRAADEEDVALSTMDSFLCGMREGRFPDLRNRKELWNLLLTIADRKVIKHRKREKSAKRGGGTVVSMTCLATDVADGAVQFDPIDAGPTEEELAIVVAEMTEGLGDRVLRLIAVRRLQGFTDQEIAAELGVTERTVIRKRRRIQAIWQRELAE